MTLHKFSLVSIMATGLCLLGPSVLAATVNADQMVDVIYKDDPLLDNLQNIPADAHTKGMWSSVADWPIVSVHAMLMPDGRVLSYGTDRSGNFDGRYFDEWDPSKGFTAESHLTRFQHSYQNSFCSTAVLLKQGEVLIAGGDTPRTSIIYDTKSAIDQEPLRKTGSDMGFDRWYPTMITLASGQPLMMGGMVPYKENMGTEVQTALNSGWASMTPELYDPQTETWRSLFGATSRAAFGPDLNRTSYPRAWVAPNGEVFGVSADKMWWLNPNGDGSVREEAESFGELNAVVPENVGSTNTAAMFDIGKILIMGGNGRGWFDGLAASKQTTVIDINSGKAMLDRSVGEMTYPRRMAMATVLSSGEVVVLGGTTEGFATDYGVYAAEIWNPDTGNWSLGSDASVFKSYHSNATLLANGSILYHGGGFPMAADGLKGQIYYPPYLFKNENGVSKLANRPKVKAISGLNYEANSAMQLEMVANDTISQLVLVGLSNGTHAFNPGQRRIPLDFSQDNFQLNASLPNNNLIPPGYYQVVALSQEGVPSKGVVIGIGRGFDTPAPPINNPTNNEPEIDSLKLNTVQPNQSVEYAVKAVNGVTYSWNFGDGSPSSTFSADSAVTHRYAKSGVFVVTLTANKSGVISTHLYLQAVLPNTNPTNLQPTASNQVAYESVATGANRVWVVNPDNNSVSVINTVSNSIVKSIPVGNKPSSIAISPDGNIWVTNKQSATISIINANTLAITDTIALDHDSQPHGLAFSPNQNIAFVALEATGELIKLASNTKTEAGRLKLGSHIRHVSVNHDTSQVFVSRFITPPLPGESTANVDTSTAGAEVLVVDPNTMLLSKTIVLQHSDKPDTQIQGSGIPNYLGAVVISPDNSKAWVPSKQDNIKRGTLRSQYDLNFQNTVRAITSSIDLEHLSENYAQRIDHDNSSLATAAVYHPDGLYAFVTLETSRQVAVIDASNGYELFKFDVGRAPQGIAISKDGRTLFVKNFTDRSLSIIDLTPLVENGEMSVSIRANVYTVPLTQEKLNASVLLGKQLFYDAKDTRLAKDSYMSCASCHADGGHDGRVWDMTGFGEGLRNTIALKGKAGMGHGFLHWSANFDEIQDFEGQIRNLAGGTGLMSDAQFNVGTRKQALGDRKAGISTELDELALYVSSLGTFDETPFGNVSKSLSTKALSGKAMFARANCMSCHTSPEKRTNSLNESTLTDIGTINQATGKRLGGSVSGVDVPSLRNLWQTGPYLHNGSALTLVDAIKQHKNLNLTDIDMPNLVQYLLEIDNDTNASLSPPTVSINTPVNNAVLNANDTLNIKVTANDIDGAIISIGLYDGDKLVGKKTQAPFEFAVNNTAIGKHIFTAVATDTDGLSTTSSPTILTIADNVINTNKPPIIAINAPSNASTFDVGSNIVLEVKASDPDGQVASVSFYQNNYLIAEIAKQPFSYTLTINTPDNYTFTAKAIDDDGAEAYSLPITINLKEVVQTQEVSITQTFKRNNQSGQLIEFTPEKYIGPVTYLEYQALGNANNDVVFGSDSNDFINLLGGNDAADGGAGDDVLDGGIGSNFLTGGTGNDIFFIDGRASQTTWSTIVDLTAGDQVNLWGYIEGVSKLISTDPFNGAEGYKGITYHYDLNNDGQIETSVTITGKNQNSNITTEAKTINGESPHLLIQLAETSALKKASALLDQPVSSNIQVSVNANNNEPPDAAIRCAEEYEYCNIPNGQRATVWYGAKGGRYLKATLSGRFICSINTFGDKDPNIGLSEYCSYQLAH